MSKRPRNTSSTATQLGISRFLCIDSRGRTRITSDAPSLAADEIAIMLKLDLPKALFNKPMLTAKIEIPAAAVNPVKLEVHSVDAISKAIRDATGLRAQIEIISPSKT